MELEGEELEPQRLGGGSCKLLFLLNSGSFPLRRRREKFSFRFQAVKGSPDLSFVPWPNYFAL